MIGKLIDFCIRHRGIVLLITALVVAAGVWSMQRITVDAIPDLSDVQVIIRTEYAGQAPQIVQDQVTYPLTTAMLSVPSAEVVRGYSMFGTSFVYVIFEDGTDLYWARSRVLEQLSTIRGSLPEGATPQLGPDATAVGWVYQYVLQTGRHCPDPQHGRKGVWHDPKAGRWHEDPSGAPSEAARERLEHHRIFRERNTCPVDGKELVESDLDLSDLRGLQDWYLRYELTAVEGVSEIAPIGGFVKQYQVTVDPVKLLAYDLPLSKVKRAIRESNLDAGGRVVERSETEYMVRGLGYLGRLSEREKQRAEEAGRRIEEVRTDRVIDQLGKVSLGADGDGNPIYLRDVARIRIGPESRRGIAEWNGEGETVGGVVVMRYGGDAMATIERTRAKLADLEAGLPPGVAVRTAYDRSDLIHRSVDTLTETLIEEMVIVAVIMVLFLLHARSALVAAFVLPTGVLITLLAMHLLGIKANIMSLGGIAIAIGVMVDSSVVMVENAHAHLERNKRRAADGQPLRPRGRVIAEAAREVGPSLFFSLLIITVSFLPVFALGGQSGRLFSPLAWTKTFAMAAAAVLAVTIIPVLMSVFVTERVAPGRWPRRIEWPFYLLTIAAPAAALALAPLPRFEAYRWWMVGGWALAAALLLLPQRITPEHRLPISRLLRWLYAPAFGLVMRLRWAVPVLAAAVVVATWWPLSQLGSEFMPPLEEGDLLYMPTTDPGLSTTKAKELLQQTDKLIAQAPEVKDVFGKIGRAETATDPAPLSMVETTITLHRDKSKWRQVPVERFFSDWPGWLRRPLSRIWPERRPITTDELVYGYTLPNPGGEPIRVPGLNEIVQMPGLTNSWTMPIKTRIDMLSTGIRTPVGIKVMGPDLATLAELSREIAGVVRTAPGLADHTTSAFPEKTTGGHYLDIEINRDQIARYGLTVADVQEVVRTAVGGMNISQTVEGLERYPINLRYPRELRDNLPELRQTLVAAPTGAQVPLGQLADLRLSKGPPMIKSENARLTSWVFVDISGLDIGTYVQRAKRAVAERVDLPPGYSLVWSGQYEYMQEARRRLGVIVPVTLVVIVLLLYAATRSWLRVGLVLTIIPLSLVGAYWLLWALGYNMSVAVWVGLIALAGLAVETGLVMLLYLDTSFERHRSEGRMRGAADLWAAVFDGAVQRVRPITMTVLTTLIALLPLLWARGAGADTMRRLAAPMVGGLATGYLAVLLVLPVLYYLARRLHRPWNASRRAEQP